MTSSMYLPGHFEPDSSVGPPSQYRISGPPRRPWSPIHYDEDITNQHGIHDYFAQDRIPESVLRGERHGGLRREGSESSVEALDLADYARTLRRPVGHHSPYPPFPHTSHIHPLSVPTPVHANRQRASPQLSPSDPYPDYPPTPDNDRPFSAQSRDTFSQSPPSLVSGDTHDSPDSFGSRCPYPSRRPYSLPPFFASTSADHLPNRGPAVFPSTSGSPHHSLVHIASPVFDEREEADISRFPAFSHGWYDDPQKTVMPKRSSLPPYSSELNHDHRGSYNPYPSTASNQSRNILPWSSQLSDVDGPPVDDAVKEERLRMLEREFGKNGKAGTLGSGLPVIGSVDEKGALVTAGPKKRIGARWAQGILAFGAAVSSLYGALFIKLPTPAPPASKLPAFALYGMSVVTFFLVLYLFAIRPCCGGKQKTRSTAGPIARGMMVLPVQGLPREKKKQKKKGKKGKYGGTAGGVHVNLIVDPGMFGGGGRGRDEYGSEEEYDNVDGSPMSSRRGAARRPGPQRRSIFQGLMMENDWKVARKFLKRMLFLDIACLVIWGGVFILILFGQKCPPGGFGGWCDSYNIASAAACILCVGFGFSVFFDIVDLHMSKASPRTRT